MTIEYENRIHKLIVDGCANGFDGHLCDEIMAEGNRLYAIQAKAEAILPVAEVIGTINGFRDLLLAVGELRDSLK